MKDPLAVRLRHNVGVRALLWRSYFVHATGDWPESWRVIEETFVGVPDDERYAILVGKAIEFFRLKDSVPGRFKVPNSSHDRDWELRKQRLRF